MRIILIHIFLVFNLQNCFAQLPNYINQDSLVGYWPFSGNANDESLNKNDGKVIGAILANDRFGNPKSAYSFSGTFDIINTNYNPNIDYFGDLTIAAWIFPKGPKMFGTWQTIVAKGNAYDFEDDLNISYEYGPNFNDPTYYKKLFTSRYYINATGKGQFIYSGDTIVQNKWQNVILTIKKDTVSFYLNGKFIGYRSNEKYFKVPHFGLTKGFSFGNSGDINFPKSFNGLLDDIGIWKRALTDMEIKHLYTNCGVEILNQPISQSSPLNSDVYMTIKTNLENVTYQWQTNTGVGFQSLSDAGQYSGSNNDTLLIKGLNSNNNNHLFRCIIKTNTCSDTSNIAKSTIGVKANSEEYASNDQVNLFPNPTKDILYVKYRNSNLNNIYIIRDYYGRIIKTGDLSNQYFEISLNNFPNGTYFFQIGNYYFKKFVVIKN